MSKASKTLTPSACFKKAAKALRSNNPELAEEWRRLGDSIVIADRG